MTDLWQWLAQCRQPLVLYGTGDGADKIIDSMEAFGVKPSGVFASDGFVRKRSFRGMPVLSYGEAKEAFGSEMVVLVAFGSHRPEVLERLDYLNRHHVLLVPDVPVAGGPRFDAAFCEANRDAIAEARTLWADDLSRDLYDATVEAKLTGRYDRLMACLSTEEDIMALIDPREFRVTMDLGAYTGDTVEALLPLAPHLETVIAMEPDERNFAKLSFQLAGDPRVQCCYAAAWDREEILTFRKGGGRGIRKDQGGKTVTVMGHPADRFLRGKRPDYIKMDVEGAERQAIEGCRDSITRLAPVLRIALYHKSADLFELPLQIHRMNPSYRLYLRRKASVPAWDLDLIARKED